MFEVLGQDFAKKAFKNMHDNKKLSHAFIIQGPDGTGKSIFANYIAASILCKDKNKPCMECISCRKILNGNHPDLKIIFSSSRSIGIDIIRKLIEDINIKPYEGDRKVIIIKEADKITAEGQNAILKTLEEPPSDTTIIMLCENLKSLLETIVSRCQVFHFGRVNTGYIKEYLINKGIDKEKAETASLLSGGILGNALKYLDKKYESLRKRTIETLKDIVRADELNVIGYTDFFISEKDNIYEILDIMQSWLRDIAVLKITKNNNIIVNRDMLEMLSKECSVLSFDRILKIINILKDTRKKLDEYLNYQLTIEVMLLNIQEV